MSKKIQIIILSALFLVLELLFPFILRLFGSLFGSIPGSQYILMAILIVVIIFCLKPIWGGFNEMLTTRMWFYYIGGIGNVFSNFSIINFIFWICMVVLSFFLYYIGFLINIFFFMLRYIGFRKLPTRYNRYYARGRIDGLYNNYRTITTFGKDGTNTLEAAREEYDIGFNRSQEEFKDLVIGGKD